MNMIELTIKSNGNDGEYDVLADYIKIGAVWFNGNGKSVSWVNEEAGTSGECKGMSAAFNAFWTYLNRPLSDD